LKKKGKYTKQFHSESFSILSQNIGVYLAEFPCFYECQLKEKMPDGYFSNNFATQRSIELELMAIERGLLSASIHINLLRFIS
jgi:hypothetical protein